MRNPRKQHMDLQKVQREDINICGTSRNGVQISTEMDIWEQWLIKLHEKIILIILISAK